MAPHSIRIIGASVCYGDPHLDAESRAHVRTETAVLFRGLSCLSVAIEAGRPWLLVTPHNGHEVPVQLDTTPEVAETAPGLKPSFVSLGHQTFQILGTHSSERMDLNEVIRCTANAELEPQSEFVREGRWGNVLVRRIREKR